MGCKEIYGRQVLDVLTMLLRLVSTGLKPMKTS